MLVGTALAPVIWCGLPTELARAGESHLLVDIGSHGQGFTDDPKGPLLDMTRLAPGSATHGVLGVRNDSRDIAGLHLAARDVQNDDNGCNHPEARVDTSCGDDQGELAEQLVFDVSTSTRRDGAYASMWHGSLAQLADGVPIETDLAAEEVVWLKVSALLPRTSGNETQTDRVGFALRVTLSLAGTKESVAVRGTTFSSGGHGPLALLDGLPSLPYTGGAPVQLAMLGALMAMAGAAVLALQRRATRSSQHSAS